MKAFVWDERFLISLASADGPHRHLVEQVNGAGGFLPACSADENALQGRFLKRILPSSERLGVSGLDSTYAITRL